MKQWRGSVWWAVEGKSLEKKLSSVHLFISQFRKSPLPALWIRFSPGLIFVLTYPWWLYLVKQYNEDQTWRRLEKGAVDLGVLLGVCFFLVLCPGFMPLLRCSGFVVVIMNISYGSDEVSEVQMLSSWTGGSDGLCSSWSWLLRCVFSSLQEFWLVGFWCMLCMLV